MIFNARITINVSRTEIDETKNAEGIVTAWTRRSIPDGTLTGDIAMSIDVDRLLKWLGSKALKSRKLKSTALSGAIVARATNLKREGAK